MDIAAWLRGLGLERYEQAFRDNDIGADLLPTLTEADLREIGVASLGHRKRLLAAIAALAGTADARPAATASAASGPSPGPRAERRQLTVLFCDLVGSTALAARLDPEDLREVMASYRRRAAEAVERRAGHVAQYLGDGVLACFGHPQAHEDDPERAVAAGLDLVGAVGGLAPPGGPALRARVGIATGLAVVGDLAGIGEAQERGMVGGTPNLAARLQAVAEPDTVVVDVGTRRLLGGLFECQELVPVEAKGFPAAVRAWRVLRRAAAESRSEALYAAAGRAPLVGRDEEVGLLLHRWARAKGGDGQVVLLSGEPGIGKSRLAADLAERLAAEPHTGLRYFCSPHHQDSPLFPVAGQLERAAGFARNDAPEAKLIKLEALLARAATPGDEFAVIADLLGFPASGRHPLSEHSPQKRREVLLAALLAQLAGLAARGPVVMLFEDAHWSDPTSLELLGLTVERIRRLPVLLVVTSRPEFRPPWAGLPQVTALALGGLGRREAAALAAWAAGDAPLPGGVADEIVERTGGIPLFVEEMTRAVVEVAWHDAAPCGAPHAGALPACAVPAALHAPLMARLDRLGPAAGEVAQVGAAIGREFPHELLATVAGRPEAELRSALDRLVEAGLVLRAGEPPQATYLFKHTLVQEAAYGTLLRTRRRALHAGVARALAGLFPEASEARPEVLAHHCALAGMAEEAVDLWGKAGRRAIGRSAMAEAAAHLRRALALLPGLPDAPARWRRELDLQTALGNALIAAEGFTVPETGRAYDRARALCERLGDAKALALIAIGQCVYHLMRAETEAALGVAEDLLRRAEREGGLEGRLAAHWLIGSAVFQTGHLHRGRRHLEVAAGILDEAGEGAARMAGGKHALVSVPASRGVVLLLVGSYDQAKAQIALALTAAKGLGRPHLLAHALGMAARHHALLDQETPRQVLDTLGELAAEHGFPYWVAELLQHRGLALAAAGEIREGLALVREGAARLDAQGAAWHAALALCVAAGLVGSAEAMVLVDEASARLERTGVRFFDAELRRVRGALLALAGDVVGAEAQFTEAISIARDQGAAHWELRAAVGLARLWCDQGRREEARSLLAPVYGWFTEGLDLPDLRSARALLDQLA